MSDLAVSRRRPVVLTASGSEEVRGAFVASAQALYGSAREQYAVQYKSWQQELWAYSKTVGEYGGVMDWFASGISRMHLRAAAWSPELREPEFLDDGPAAEAMHRLVTNAKNGETQYLWKWGRHLAIPGAGYFTAWTREDGSDVFDVKSAEQIRRSTVPFKELNERGREVVAKDAYGQVLTGYDIRTGPDEWQKLPRSQLVGRIYRPDDELDYEASSWSRAALTTLREIDLYNRHIVATLLSRLVFNGILLIPEEVTFPVNPQFKDAPDPFIAELLAVAQRGIKDPGSPGSAIPFPLRVKSQFIESFKHLILATGVDPKIIEGRTSAVKRLSEQLPAPPEAMSGKGDLNHWNAWKDDQDNVKMYFGPTMEILCGGITDVYLHPIMRADGKPVMLKDGRKVIAWYDDSDLVSDPDNSENAKDARDRIVITNEAYLEQLNLDSADMPSDEEQRKMILVDLARQGLPTPDSFYLLYPEDKPDPMEQATEAAEAQDAANKILGIDPAAGPTSSNVGPSGAAKPAAADQKKSAEREPAKPPRGG